MGLTYILNGINREVAENLEDSELGNRFRGFQR